MRLRPFASAPCPSPRANDAPLLGPIGDVPPAEFGAQYYQQAAVA